MSTISPLRPFNGIHPVIGQRVMIDPMAVIIGQVTLKDDVNIWPTAVLRGDINRITIGKRSNIQDGCVIHVDYPDDYATYDVILGEDVTVGHRAILHACHIGDRVLIGMGAIVLNGAIIESDIILGAGSLVPQHKHLKAGYLYLGSPAKAIRKLTDNELDGLRTSADNYVRLKEQFLAEGRL